MRTDQPSRAEFIALMAMTVATVAFSIDAMLPALTTIGTELSPEQPNKAQFVLIAFMLGMGTGTLFVGVLADAFGRRPVIFAGAAVFMAAAAAAALASSLEALLGARFVQGLGASAPRIVALAVVRDLYKGRSMARIMSFILAVFSLVPVVAPAIGAGLIAILNWRAIFVAFIAFSVVSSVWYWARLGETLAPSERRALTARGFLRGLFEVASIPRTRRAITALAFLFGVLFTMLSTVQPIFARAFDAEDIFPFWFALVAVLAASGAVLNGWLVERVGMRRMVLVASGGLSVLSAGFVAAMLAGISQNALAFPAFIALMTAVFFAVSVSMGNLNALAMEPLGHMAGMAASVVGSVATIAGAGLASVASFTFDGSATLPAGFIAAYSLATFGILATIRD